MHKISFQRLNAVFDAAKLCLQSEAKGRPKEEISRNKQGEEIERDEGRGKVRCDPPSNLGPEAQISPNRYYHFWQAPIVNIHPCKQGNGEEHIAALGESRLQIEQRYYKHLKYTAKEVARLIENH